MQISDLNLKSFKFIQPSFSDGLSTASGTEHRSFLCVIENSTSWMSTKQLSKRIFVCENKNVLIEDFEVP